ncbi:hypothetical protein ACFLVZ_01950 [Chloroflexota bacterium]
MESDTDSISLQPGYVSSLSNAVKQLKTYWSGSLVVGLTVWMINLILSLPNYALFDNPGLSFTYSFIISIVSGVLFFGFMFAALRVARGEKPSVYDLIQPFKQFFTVIFSYVLSGIIVSLGVLLFIIPGIFFTCRLAFFPYLVMDQKTGVFGAIGGSWNMTKGHFWRIFLLGLTVYVIFFGIGIINLFILFLVSGSTGIMEFIYSLSSMRITPFSPSYWIPQLLLSLVCIPVYLYLLVAWGSLYHAIKLEKTGALQANTENPASLHSV